MTSMCLLVYASIVMAATMATSIVALDSSCYVTPSRGLCGASLPRYTYNSLTGQCEPFTYGGCGSTTNLHLYPEDCRNTCGVSNDFCQLARDSGSCSNPSLAWYFDTAAAKCRHFVYMGCGGNANRFPSVKDCHAACGEGLDTGVGWSR